MATDGSEIYEDLNRRVREGGFAVALSGGGHRATLATLGALLALVDRGLGPKIMQIASVSGGSITNAFVAQRCQLGKLQFGELDHIATELATTIIRKGVLTKSWIVALVVASIVLAIFAGKFVFSLLVPWTSLSVTIGVISGATVFIANGLLVEWLLDRRYFRVRNPSSKGMGRARLSSLSGRPIDHVFCMTDLVLGLPVYASSQHGGMIWRRLTPDSGTNFKSTIFQTFSGGQLSLAEVVRASAAFPGIAPRRMRIPPDPQIELVAKLPTLAFLADGGIWNNLATHVLREDHFIGNYATWDNGVLRPIGNAPAAMPLLCVNGSAPHIPTRSWMFQIPGVALFKSLFQVTQIQNTNTVLPRISSMIKAFNSRVWRTQRAEHLDPLDLLVDLKEIAETKKYCMAGALKEEFIRETDPAIKTWEQEALSRFRFVLKPDSDHGMDLLAYLRSIEHEPKGSYPVSGFANIVDWDALTHNSLTWKQLIEKEGIGTVDAPTTLDRVERALARRLIARGYLNTYLISLFLAPLHDDDLVRLDTLSERLDKIVGV